MNQNSNNMRKVLLVIAAIMMCGTVNLSAQETYTDIGFTDIADVFANLKKKEKVVFLLRHGERGRDYSKNGLLTENGKAQARTVGEKIDSDEQAFYAHSDYGRTIQTCENIAIGRGDEFIHEEWSFLGGDWYRKDIPAIRQHGWDNWESLSQWAYEGGKEEGFYNLEERSEEWLDSLRAHLPSMKRINVLVSHDYMVTPMAVYASDKQIDLHYWVNHKWINYLAGVAIIIDKKGRMTFKVIRGLDSGVLGQ